MHRHDQIALLKRLLNYVDTRTTAMADAPWRNDVSVYTDTKHLAEEQQILFRQHPILMGFASEWAKPGDFRTDDYVGVPVLVVRGRDGKLRAFLNVCRHRGAKVAEGGGTARLFSWDSTCVCNLRRRPAITCVTLPSNNNCKRAVTNVSAASLPSARLCPMKMAVRNRSVRRWLLPIFSAL